METQNTKNTSQLVWAKVSGYPWWPAIIGNHELFEESLQELTLVNFVGHNSHSYLTKDKIRNYDEFYLECSKTKSIALLRAISDADLMKNGLLTFQEHQSQINAANPIRRMPKLKHKICHKLRKTISSVKKIVKGHRNSKKNLELTTTEDSSRESFDLEEILSTNPFQRISRSLIKELNIKTTVNSHIKKDKPKPQQSKIAKKPSVLSNSIQEVVFEEETTSKCVQTPKLQIETFSKSIQTQKLQNENLVKENQTAKLQNESSTPKLQNEDFPKNGTTSKKISLADSNPQIEDSLQNCCNLLENDNSNKKSEANEKKIAYEKNLEDCLFKLSSKRTKSIIALLSKLLGLYHDLGFSGEELFKGNIPKIFKTMYAVIKDVRSENIDFAKIQLESILNHITDKVLHELLNNKTYIEKLSFQQNTDQPQETPTEILQNPTKVVLNNPTKVDPHLKNHKKVELLKNQRKVELIKNTNKAELTTSTTTTTQKIEGKSKKILKKKEEIKKKTVKNPELRKKICLKLAKILQKNYLAEKLCSQELSLSIEGKIRNEFPLMNKEYKTYIKMIFCLIKRKKLNYVQLNDIFSLDFKHSGPILKELSSFDYETDQEKKCLE